jgi:transcriptional regulator with XRE-family HTH domain
MAAGFRTRRVKTEGLSIGDRLKRARTRQKLSIGDVEEATKIRAKFLLALESDSWEQIPSEVYGRGYLEAYTEFLKIDSAAVMRDYDKLRGVFARHCQDGKVELVPTSTLKTPRVILTPRLALSTVLVIATLGVGAALMGQVRQYASAPYLELLSPAHAQGESDPGLIVTTESLKVTGRTVLGAVVRVNGSLAQVSEDGTFEYLLSVQKGVNAVVVEATSPNGRKSSQVTSVVVK